MYALIQFLVNRSLKGPKIFHDSKNICSECPILDIVGEDETHGAVRAAAAERHGGAAAVSAVLLEARHVGAVHLQLLVKLLLNHLLPLPQDGELRTEILCMYKKMVKNIS